MIIKDHAESFFVIKGTVTAIAIRSQFFNKKVGWAIIDNPFEVYLSFNNWSEEFSKNETIIFWDIKSAIDAIDSLKKIDYNSQFNVYDFKLSNFKIISRRESQEITENIIDINIKGD